MFRTLATFEHDQSTPLGGYGGPKLHFYNTTLFRMNMVMSEIITVAIASPKSPNSPLQHAQPHCRPWGWGGGVLGSCAVGPVETLPGNGRHHWPVAKTLAGHLRSLPLQTIDNHNGLPTFRSNTDVVPMISTPSRIVMDSNAQGVHRYDVT